MSRFDHVEVHVSDINRYCEFLVAVFDGGSFEVISKSGTSMFTSPEGINIEVKKKKIDDLPTMSGFCNPCLRRPDPKALLARLDLHIESEQDAPFGKVYFFRDHEGVTWHIKDLPE
ncbi:MAG: VOC family protein [Chlorobium sp.]